MGSRRHHLVAEWGPSDVGFRKTAANRDHPHRRHLPGRFSRDGRTSLQQRNLRTSAIEAFLGSLLFPPASTEGGGRELEDEYLD